MSAPTYVTNPMPSLPSHWDERFMDLARFVAEWSKDRSRKVGCVVVGPGREVRSLGYNGFPRNVNDDVEERHQRPAKYRWTEHAERNALFNAGRTGTSLLGCTMYVPWFPCMDCARAIVQCGITQLVAIEPDWDDSKFGTEFKEVPVLLRETGVLLRFIAGPAMGPPKEILPVTPV